MSGSRSGSAAPSLDGVRRGGGSAPSPRRSAGCAGSSPAPRPARRSAIPAEPHEGDAEGHREHRSYGIRPLMAASPPTPLKPRASPLWVAVRRSLARESRNASARTVKRLPTRPTVRLAASWRTQAGRTGVRPAPCSASPARVPNPTPRPSTRAIISRLGNPVKAPGSGGWIPRARAAVTIARATGCSKGSSAPAAHRSRSGSSPSPAIAAISAGPPPACRSCPRGSPDPGLHGAGLRHQPGHPPPGMPPPRPGRPPRSKGRSGGSAQRSPDPRAADRGAMEAMGEGQGRHPMGCRAGRSPLGLLRLPDESKKGLRLIRELGMEEQVR